MAIPNLISRREMRLQMDDKTKKHDSRMDKLRTAVHLGIAMGLSTLPMQTSFLVRFAVLMATFTMIELLIRLMGPSPGAVRQRKYRRRGLLSVAVVLEAFVVILMWYNDSDPLSEVNRGILAPGISGDVIVSDRGAISLDVGNDRAAGLVHFAAEKSKKLDDLRHPTSEDVSVIIPVRDEEDYIAKTVRYTLENTPKEMIRDIVVVDDASKIPTEDVLRNELPASMMAKVKVVRFDSPNGLIRARIVGADASASDNIFFMDGHCKPKPGWLTPLLKHLQANYKRIVCPTIQDIDRFTWADKGTQGFKMMFDWMFEFSWYEDLTDEVPISAGGILALTRKWWNEGGKYDPGMLEWGGENIEQSLRTWMCGGEIFVVRDSFVGHIFDRPPKPNPGNKLVEQVQKNQKRAALVWLDDYYKFMQNDHSVVNSLDEGSGIADRMALRQALKCNSFQWYVERFRNSFERKQLLKQHYHHIRHRATKLCLQPEAADEHKYKGEAVRSRFPFLSLGPCNSQNTNQQWQVVAGRRMLENRGMRICMDVRGMAGRSSEMLHMDRNELRGLAFECDWNGTFKVDNHNQFWQFDAWEPRSNSIEKIEGSGTQKEGYSGHIFTFDTDAYRSRTGVDILPLFQARAVSPTSVCLTAEVTRPGSSPAEHDVFFAPCKEAGDPSGAPSMQEWVWLW